MVKFSDEHKKDLGNNKYFEEGVHKVKIMLVEFGETEDKKQPYAEFTVTDEEGEREDKARVWFTTDKAINYSFNIIKGIFVHNAPEDGKDKMREKIDGLEDTEALAKACQLLVGKEAWFSVYQNKERPYVKQDGSTGYSYDRNITGYEPKPRPTAATGPATVSATDTGAPAPDNTKPIVTEDGQEIFAF